MFSENPDSLCTCTVTVMAEHHAHDGKQRISDIRIRTFLVYEITENLLIPFVDIIRIVFPECLKAFFSDRNSHVLISSFRTQLRAVSLTIILDRHE